MLEIRHISASAIRVSARVVITASFPELHQSGGGQRNIDGTSSAPHQLVLSNTTHGLGDYTSTTAMAASRDTSSPAASWQTDTDASVDDDMDFEVSLTDR